MPSQKRCNILSYDYLDIDVFWNIKLFYKAAGYRIDKNGQSSQYDLLVMLRGDPGNTLNSYTGTVHIYDYVKELKFNWRSRMPHAREIFLVSLSKPEGQEHIQYVQGYLPIIPELWQEKPFRKLPERPLHISNYKSISNDIYQQDLVRLGQAHLIRVFGKKWEKVDIRSHGVSYWQANRMIAKAYSCYGLMYPYQRGTTLSGRMWQAPLNGCFVLTEVGTNRFQCPGLIEVERYSPATLVTAESIRSCWVLKEKATKYWRQQTVTIAKGLGLDIDPDILAIQSVELRKEIFRHHLHFLLRQRWSRILQLLTPPLIACRIRRNQQRMASLLRHLRRG